MARNSGKATQQTQQTQRVTTPAKRAGGATPTLRTVVLIATRKGAWLLHGDGKRKTWRVDGPHFLGHIINHLVLDPRDGRTLLAAAKTGHLGPTIFRSTNLGRSWKEAKRPPAFAKATQDSQGRAVDHTFWLTPCHGNEPKTWYAGTSPQGLFRSDDGGNTWDPFSYINDDPQYRSWMGSVQDGTPDGPKLHSIIVDPRDPVHLYFAMSGGGVHESTDGGRSFKPLVSGMEVVAGFDAANIAFHDPHCVRLCPSNPDRLYQQNHCGIYRLDRPSTVWTRIGKRMPKRVGDVGFPMVTHPRDAESRRLVFRHHQRRSVDESRRRQSLGLHRAQSAGNLCGRSCRGALKAFNGGGLVLLAGLSHESINPHAAALLYQRLRSRRQR